MRTSSYLSHPGRQRGSILVICMVLAGVGTIGAAAFFSLIHAKSQEATERETAMVRRTKLANSKALAKEAVLRLHLGAPGVPAGGNLTYALADGWGEVTIDSHAVAPLTVVSATRVNKTGTTAHTAFTEDIAVTLNDGDAPHRFQAQAKSWPPALGGDLLTAQRPTGTGAGATQFTGNLLVKGRAVFHPANYSTATSTLRADRVILASHSAPKLSLLNTAGVAILPENSVKPATTSGLVGGEPAFDGRVSLIGNPSTTVNDYVDFVAAAGGKIIAAGAAIATTEGQATIAASGNDATLLGIIHGLAADLPDTLPATFRTYRPLSSQVLSSLIARSTITDTTVLTAILVDNSPLPEDVLQLVVNGTAPLGDNLMHVLRANPTGVAVTSAGTVYIDLDSTATDHTVINGGVSNLILRGQEDSSAYDSAAFMSPLVIVINETGTTPLATISLEGRNNRPVILALRKAGDFAAPTLSFSGTSAFPTWRSIIDLEGVALTVNTSAVSAATLIGGIRTDRSINVAAGTLTLERETSLSAGLQNIASRHAWLELVNIP